MNAWQNVKVKAEGEHKGRAGVVMGADKDSGGFVVALDADVEREGVRAIFAEDELQVLM